MLLAFISSSVHALWPTPLTRNLLQARRQTGLAAAVSHTFHLLMLGTLANIAWLDDWGPFGTPAELAPSIFVYVVLYFMALTSNNLSQRTLGHSWRYLHRIGIYILMLAFTGAYAGAAIDFGGHYWFYAAMGVAAFGLRFAARRARRNKHLEEPRLDHRAVLEAHRQRRAAEAAQG